jgi:hypothetical protein
VESFGGRESGLAVASGAGISLAVRAMLLTLFETAIGELDGAVELLAGDPTVGARVRLVGRSRDDG